MKNLKLAALLLVLTLTSCQSSSQIATTHYNCGLAKSELGDKRGAISDYSEAIKIKPDFVEAYYNRGVAKSALGDRQGALLDFREAGRLFEQQGNVAGSKLAEERIQELER